MLDLFFFEQLNTVAESLSCQKFYLLKCHLWAQCHKLETGIHFAFVTFLQFVHGKLFFFFTVIQSHILIPTLTWTPVFPALSLTLSSPLLTLTCNKDAQISSIHKCQLFDGLSWGFWETLEPELLHHSEIITLEETQNLHNPSVVSDGHGIADEF